MTQTLLLSGRPGVGKTTLIKAVVHKLGERADGFYTEEIRQLGKRQGFRLVGLRGERATLAHVQFRQASRRGRQRGHPRVGRYGVDVTALDQIGVAALERAMAQGRIVIVDEIGKMELFSEAFRTAVLMAIDGPTPMIATVMARPHPWVDALKARPDVTLWQVTVENRDVMVRRVLEWVQPVQETRRD